MFLFFLSCAPETPVVTGADLLETYNVSFCEVFTQSSCGVTMAGCGSPAVIFSDEEACLDARTNVAAGCEGIEGVFLSNQRLVEECVEQLSAAAETCAEQELCINDTTIINEGACSEVQALFTECS